MARSRFRAGDRERAKALFRALPLAARKGTSRALLEAATELAAAIKRAVPVDHGDLRDSVRVKRGKRQDQSRGRNQDAGTDPDLTVRVTEGDRKTFYAPFVEFGTKDRPAHPHFWPTYRANKRRLSRRIKAAQRKALREANKHV